MPTVWIMLQGLISMPWPRRSGGRASRPRMRASAVAATITSIAWLREALSKRSGSIIMAALEFHARLHELHRDREHQHKKGHREDKGHQREDQLDRGFH